MGLQWRVLNNFFMVCHGSRFCGGNVCTSWWLTKVNNQRCCVKWGRILVHGHLELIRVLVKRDIYFFKNMPLVFESPWKVRRIYRELFSFTWFEFWRNSENIRESLIKACACGWYFLSWSREEGKVTSSMSSKVSVKIFSARGLSVEKLGFQVKLGFSVNNAWFYLATAQSLFEIGLASLIFFFGRRWGLLRLWSSVDEKCIKECKKINVLLDQREWNKRRAFQVDWCVQKQLQKCVRSLIRIDQGFQNSFWKLLGVCVDLITT